MKISENTATAIEIALAWLVAMALFAWLVSGMDPTPKLHPAPTEEAR